MSGKQGWLRWLMYLMFWGLAACGSEALPKAQSNNENADPCAEAVCGTRCSPCDGAGPECTAPAVDMACNDEGECVIDAEDLCGEYQPCAEKECGEKCTLCDPSESECAEPTVELVCDSSGQCRADFDAAQCRMEFNDCEGKECGASCYTCDPEDPECVLVGAPTACNADGQCVVGEPGDVCEADLCEDVTCPGTTAYCEGTVAHPAQADGECDSNTGSCQYPPGLQPQDCAEMNQACEDGECVEIDRCAEVECPSYPATCQGNLAISAQEYLCDPTNGECVPPPGVPPRDCEAMGMICKDGDCIHERSI